MASNAATTTGQTSMISKNKPTTHLGNKELHRRHSVMIEPGNIPRAKVMDQHIFDRYLMLGSITLAQHRAAEHLLALASRAGVWAAGSDWGGSGVRSNEKSRVPYGMFPFGRALVSIRRRHGAFHAYITEQVICRDCDVSDDPYRFKCFKEALDVIDLHHTGFKNPVSKLRSAIKKGAP